MTLKSAVVIIPDALLAQGNALCAAMGWGPVAFTIPLRTGATVTHWAARADVSPVFEGLLAAPPAAITAAFGSVLAAMQVNLSQSLWGSDHLSAVISDAGFTR
jgi:hypothetical protein